MPERRSGEPKSLADGSFLPTTMIIGYVSRLEQAVASRRVRKIMNQRVSQPLWRPSSYGITHCHYANFVRQLGICEPPTALSAENVYEALHRWSVEHPGEFWRHVWRYVGLNGELGDIDFEPDAPIWKRPFFPRGRLNFAENILQSDKFHEYGFADSTAIITADESGCFHHISRRKLYESVAKLASYFRESGISVGDRVAAVLPNRLEAVIGLLAASSVGAIWTCCSTDFGDSALLDRFSQIEPSVLISAGEVCYAGKLVPLELRVGELIEKMPSVRKWIQIAPAGMVRRNSRVGIIDWNDIQLKAADPLEYERLPFNHPLYILYSSGTTGKPKCIVHGAGGALLQHAKEHVLHLDIHHSDTMFYYTSTGWMMWNWLVSALATAKSIVLFDGSPVFPDMSTLWELSEKAAVTHFGASARYYAALQQASFVPRECAKVSSLRCVLSTGSPLLPEQFEWIYSAVDPKVHLASISGGTDIVSCFVLGNPTLPVYAGEIQCKGLGMDVRVIGEDGFELKNQPGELVCSNAFPSMPLGFWNDPDRHRFKDAYFERFPGMWWHGDWVMRTNHGGYVIYGRSDATLNPGGVRIGTGEIYQQVQAFGEIAEAIATGLKKDGDERIVLFVRMRDDHILTDQLSDKIRKRLRDKCSPRHVPAYIVSVPDLPRTLSGKLSEIAVRNALAGQAIGNFGALANSECLDFFKTWAREKSV